jgi:hypothetical protein
LITLPKAPDGDQYEDLVAACLRALGYFIETRLVLRDGKKEVLELDIVATPTGQTIADRQLFEAKIDGVKFPNVFKLYGQRMYLNIPQACLVSYKTVEKNHFPVYESRAHQMGVRIAHLSLGADDLDVLAPTQNTLTDPEREAVISAAWYQQISKRLALAEFNATYASKKFDPVCARAKEYIFGVHAGFFEPTPLERAESLYSAYQATPRLSGEAVAMLAAELNVAERTIWNQVNDRPVHLWIQMIMHLETTARLRIIKNALDDFLTRGAAPPPTTVLKVGSLSVDMPLHALPQSFLTGLTAMQAHKYALHLPYLFQCYAELMGGFIAVNDTAELEFVERLTGVPTGEVISALRLIDSFFSPVGGSMLFTQQDELLLLKMTPAYVRGGGAFLRQKVFGLDNYPDRYPKLGWLMAKWHNALYGILEPSLKT